MSQAPGIHSASEVSRQFLEQALDHLSQEQLQAAKMACLRALQADAENPAALVLLGDLELQAGNLDHAEVHIRSALNLAPDLATAHERLGAVLMARQQPDQARACYAKVRQLDPEFSERNNQQGLELQARGLPAKAIARYLMAVAVTPDFASAYYNLGIVYAELGHKQTAIDYYLQALQINPDYPKVHSNLGVIYKSLGRTEEALACYQKAIALDPGFAVAYNNLGSIYMDMGRFDAAEQAFRQALQRDPELAESRRRLTDLKTFTEVDDDIRALEQRFSRADTDDDKKTLYAFGLAKAMEDLGRFDQAFDYLQAGNRLKRRSLSFSIDAERQNFDAIKTLFSKDLFDRNRDAGSTDGSPVFILGMPRSGTTLVEQILSSHADVYGAGELDTLRQTTSDYFPSLDRVLTESHDPAPDPARFAKAGADYLTRRDAFIAQASEPAAATFVTDKMPDNFRLIGLIRLMLPNAKVIHCVRHPMATCLSIYKRLFAVDGLRFSYDLEELGQFYKLYLDLMAHWHRVLPGFVYDVRYEDLVADQEAHSRALVAHCGLPWDANCLAFHKSRRAVRTASATQVRKPIYRKSVALWQNYEPYLEPLKAALGE